MELEEWGKRLRDQYEAAKRNEAVCQVILFGIEYSQEIQQSGYLLREIVDSAGLPGGYLAELSKGIKLARYVEMKPEA